MISSFNRSFALLAFVLALAGGVYFLVMRAGKAPSTPAPVGTAAVQDANAARTESASGIVERSPGTSRESVSPRAPELDEAAARNEPEQVGQDGLLSLPGRVVDAATGEGCRAMLWVTRSMKRVRTEPTLADGTFSVDDLEPGIYAIGASDPNSGAGAVENIELTGTGEPPEVVIRLTPGGKLSIRYQRTDIAHASYEVHLKSAIVAHGTLMRDVVFPVRVPAGELEVVLLDAVDGAVASQFVSVGDGTQVAVNFE